MQNYQYNINYANKSLFPPLKIIILNLILNLIQNPIQNPIHIPPTKFYVDFETKCNVSDKILLKKFGKSP